MKPMGLMLGLVAILSWAPAPGEEWMDQAVEAFGRAQYDKALDLANESSGGPRNAQRIVSFFCRMERSIITRDRADTVAWKGDYKPLYVAIGTEDIPLLLSLEGAGGPYTKKYAAAFLEAAHKKVAALQEMEAVRAHLHGRDPRTRAAAAAALGKLLSVRREVVETGGSLSEEDQGIFTDPGIIRPLVEMVALQRSTREQAKGLIPKGLRREYVAASADDCLVYIEEPAVPYLEAVVEKRGARTREALDAIRSAIARRLEKHPESNWASASGKAPARDATQVVAPCGKCKASPGGIFCGRCGSPVEETPK